MNSSCTYIVQKEAVNINFPYQLYYVIKSCTIKMRKAINSKKINLQIYMHCHFLHTMKIYYDSL